MTFSQNKRVNLVAAIIAAVTLLAAADPAFAQVGGVAKANATIELALTILRGISVAAFTIALMVCGFKYWFQSARLGDLVPIAGGGILVAAAAEIARYMLG